MLLLLLCAQADNKFVQQLPSRGKRRTPGRGEGKNTKGKDQTAFEDSREPQGGGSGGPLLNLSRRGTNGLCNGNEWIPKTTFGNAYRNEITCRVLGGANGMRSAPFWFPLSYYRVVIRESAVLVVHGEGESETCDHTWVPTPTQAGRHQATVLYYEGVHM